MGRCKRAPVPVIQAELVTVMTELADLKTAASLVFDLSVDLPEPAAQKVGYLAQRIIEHADGTIAVLRGGKPTN